MKLRRHSDEMTERSGRVRAAALLVARNCLNAPFGGRRWVLTLGLVGAVLLVLTGFASVASADPPSGVSARSQIASLEEQADELNSQIAQLDQELEASTEAYNQMLVQLNELNVTMITLRQQRDLAERDYQYRLRLYEERLCDLYKAGGKDEMLQLLLEATDAGDFIERAQIAAELADQDRRLMENLTESADRLEQVITAIDETKSNELIVRNRIRDEKEYIETNLTARRDTLAQVDSELNVLIEAERQRQAEEQARLQQMLATMLNGGQVYNGVLPQTDEEIIDQFLQTAAAYMGVEYVWGGERPSTGMDCSGYTRFVYRQHGINLPHYSGYQAVLGLPVDRANIQPGDLLAFGFPVHHVGIYVGDDLFIHAAGTGLGVRIGRLSERTNLAAIRRFDLKPRSGAPAYY